VALSAVPTKFSRGLLLRAPGAEDMVPNTDVIFIGGHCASPATGMPLIPGGVLDLPCDDPS
jgi:hypothetical protein